MIGSFLFSSLISKTFEQESFILEGRQGFNSTQTVQISSILIMWKTGCQRKISSLLIKYLQILIKCCPPYWTDIALSWSNTFLPIDQTLSEIFQIEGSWLNVPLLILELIVQNLSNFQLIFFSYHWFIWLLWFYIGSFECYQHQIWLQKMSRDWELCTSNYLFHQIDI